MGGWKNIPTGQTTLRQRLIDVIEAEEKLFQRCFVNALCSTSAALRQTMYIHVDAMLAQCWSIIPGAGQTLNQH